MNNNYQSLTIAMVSFAAILAVINTTNVTPANSGSPQNTSASPSIEATLSPKNSGKNSEIHSGNTRNISPRTPPTPYAILEARGKVDRCKTPRSIGTTKYCLPKDYHKMISVIPRGQDTGELTMTYETIDGRVITMEYGTWWVRTTEWVQQESSHQTSASPYGTAQGF